jgi:hypothetical protein
VRPTLKRQFIPIHSVVDILPQLLDVCCANLPRSAVQTLWQSKHFFSDLVVVVDEVPTGTRNKIDSKEVLRRQLIQYEISNLVREGR